MQIYSCAAVSTPEGGPKDNTPPELISSNPKSGSLQFKGGEVILSFSEYIDERSILNYLSLLLSKPFPFFLVFLTQSLMVLLLLVQS